MDENPYPALTRQGIRYLNRRRLPWLLLLLVGVVAGMVALPEMRFRFVILGLIIVLHVSIWTIFTRCVRVYRERDIREGHRD